MPEGMKVFEIRVARDERAIYHATATAMEDAISMFKTGNATKIRSDYAGVPRIVSVQEVEGALPAAPEEASL